MTTGEEGVRVVFVFLFFAFALGGLLAMTTHRGDDPLATAQLLDAHQKGVVPPSPPVRFLPSALGFCFYPLFSRSGVSFRGRFPLVFGSGWLGFSWCFLASCVSLLHLRKLGRPTRKLPRPPHPLAWRIWPNPSLAGSCRLGAPK